MRCNWGITLQINAEHARTFNPAGISYRDAMRSLRLAGYDDSRIAVLIEIVGDDSWGEHIWRWRTDYQPPWETETVAAWRLAERR
jgi:hypothetical protein